MNGRDADRGRRVDAQVHVWTAADWGAGQDEHMRAIHGEQHTFPTLLGEMDDASVGAALLVVPGWCGWDNGYALAAARQHPDRFGVVGRVDPSRPSVADHLADWAADPAAAGVRITSKTVNCWTDGTYAPFLDGAAELDLPVCAYPGPAGLAALGAAARRHPRCRIVVDHAGLTAPPVTRPPRGRDPFEPIDDLVKLAEHANVAVKVTGLPSLSAEQYPHRDLWPVLRRIVDAFGPHRVMWGSDTTRLRARHSYSSVTSLLQDCDSLDSAERRWLEGETARSVFARLRSTPTPDQPERQGSIG